MSLLKKQYNFYSEKKTRKTFMNNEIFFNSYFLLKQTRYSNNLEYLSFKGRLDSKFLTKIKNCCLITGNSRSINARLKLSYIKIARKIDSGSLVGFYRAL